MFSDCIEAYIYSSQDPQQWVQPLLALMCNEIEIQEYYFSSGKVKTVTEALHTVFYAQLQCICAWFQKLFKLTSTPTCGFYSDKILM